MKKIILDGEWRMRESSSIEYMPATVPGCVHTDLMQNGRISDVFYRKNADKIRWIEEKDWIYERDFEVSETEGAVLVFDGLDTYCDIEINGVCVGHCEDMFIQHRLTISHVLHPGKNNIRVLFYSPIRMVEGKEKREGAFTTERLHSRRMQCTYGWDWVERFVGCGIYRSVSIVYDRHFRCSDAYVYTTHVDSYGAQVCVQAEFCNIGKGEEVLFAVLDADDSVLTKRRVYIDTPRFQTEFQISNPVLWDIREENNRPYRLRILAGDEVYETPFGIRTMRILQCPDAPGSPEEMLSHSLRQTDSGLEYDQNTESSSFEVILNGRKVMCKGANWVPCEPFPSDESKEKITRILELAKRANLNMIRVWGGGVFEQEHFYNECDRLGIMVVQDYMMACGHYPEKEEWFIQSLNSEAEYITKRLRNHPSLMWWHGDNENAVNGCDADCDYMGRDAAFKGIMPFILKNDFTRPFLISSPWGGRTNASKTVGTTHNTQFLGSFFQYVDGESDGSDYLEYMKDYTARFISEEPCFGAAMYDSLRRFMTDEDIFEGENIWIYHSKGNPALPDETMNYYGRFAQKLFGKFTDGADRLFKMQYLQYELIRITMENARRNKGYCGGEIYWMLNDCWPAAAGWALIDYYLTVKSGYYAFEKYAADGIVSLDCKNGEYLLYLCNDSDGVIDGRAVVDEIDPATGEILDTQTLFVSADAEKSACYRLGKKCEHSVLVADFGKSRASYQSGRCLITPCAPPRVTEMGEDSMTLVADGYIHAVRLSGAARFSDNFFIMKPGEVRSITFEGKTAPQIDVCAYCLIKK
ncbi:MAG: hypothetical protein E7409_03415 [Ruminococcaceae bacterium]|nr:hypothetical protein [Oscillospiraceae bacterium]